MMSSKTRLLLAWSSILATAFVLASDAQAAATGKLRVDDSLAYSMNLTNGLSVGDSLVMEAIIPSTTEPRSIITHLGCTRAIRIHLVVDEKNVAHQLTLCFSDPDPFIKLGSQHHGDWVYTTGSDLIPFEPYLETGKAFTLIFSMWSPRGLTVELMPSSGNERRHYWWTHPPDSIALGTKVRRLDVWESNSHIEVKRVVFKTAATLRE